MTAKGPLHAVVLAAGRGARFGGGKLLADYGGRPVLEAALETAFAAPVAGVTLVLGCDADRVRAAAERRYLEAVRSGALQIVEAEHWAQGMAASLQAGVGALPSDAVGVFVLLGDMPRIPHAVLSPLAEVLFDDATAAAPVWQGRRGHPVLIGAALFPAIHQLEGDRGAGALLATLGPGLAEIPAPNDGVLFDVDEPGDLER